jgi:roadblock/LC7 domain-containing protein
MRSGQIGSMEFHPTDNWLAQSIYNHMYSNELEDHKMKIKLFRSLAMIVLALLVVMSASAFAAAPINAETEKDVPAGGTIHVSAGNCGATMINAPEKGTLKLENNISPAQPKGLKFYKKACELTYEDADGMNISSTKGSMVNFINLTKDARFLWDSGDLGFSVYNGSTWTSCSPYLVSAGEYGRLACWTHTVGTFGLVDLREKAAEEAEEKDPKAKKPNGDPIAAGQSMSLNTGRCGAMLPNAPVSGYVELKNGQTIPHVRGLRFVQEACELSYMDEAEREIKTYKGFLTNYIVLTNGLNLMWQDGDLALYVLDGKTWKPCNAYWVAGGGYGRLACHTDNVGMFSLVDTGVKDKDSDE